MKTQFFVLIFVILAALACGNSGDDDDSAADDDTGDDDTGECPETVNYLRDGDGVIAYCCTWDWSCEEGKWKPADCRDKKECDGCNDTFDETTRDCS